MSLNATQVKTKISMLFTAEPQLCNRSANLLGNVILIKC